MHKKTPTYFKSRCLLLIAPFLSHSTEDCDTLKGDHTDEAIRERIAGTRKYVAPTKTKKAFAPPPTKVSLLIDIQEKLAQGKGAGYERWAKVHILKQMAKTLIYLQEHGLDDYDELDGRASEATAKFNSLSARMKELEGELTANAELQKQIVTYSKTRNVYVQYRKSGYSMKFKAQHEADIILHQTAKRAFDELGLSKLPSVSSLRDAYAKLLDEKKSTYREFRQARDDMKEILTAKANALNLLGSHEQDVQRENETLRR